MHKRILTMPAIKLVGITARTSNSAEMNPATAKIGLTMQRFFGTGLSTMIVNSKDQNVTYCVYTDYENDYNGAYTYFIGQQVTSFEKQSDIFFQLTIPEQTYTQCTTQAGVMPKVCIDAWGEIWNMNSKELGGTRNYKADFERYDERAIDPNNAILEIFIGIKPI